MLWTILFLKHCEACNNYVSLILNYSLCTTLETHIGVALSVHLTWKNRALCFSLYVHPISTFSNIHRIQNCESIYMFHMFLHSQIIYIYNIHMLFSLARRINQYVNCNKRISGEISSWVMQTTRARLPRVALTHPSRRGSCWP